MHPNLGLHYAAAIGDIAKMRSAIDHGQPPCSSLDGLLPLHAASSGGHEGAVRLLLRQGANVNAPRERPKSSVAPGTGKKGATALHFAAANGHTHIVRLLLNNGAQIRVAEDGCTPQDLAETNKHWNCIALLKGQQDSAASFRDSACPNVTPHHPVEATMRYSSPMQRLRNQSSFRSLPSIETFNMTGMKASLNSSRKSFAKISSKHFARNLVPSYEPDLEPLLKKVETQKTEFSLARAQSERSNLNRTSSLPAFGHFPVFNAHNSAPEDTTKGDKNLLVRQRSKFSPNENAPESKSASISSSGSFIELQRTQSENLRVCENKLHPSCHAEPYSLSSRWEQVEKLIHPHSQASLSSEDYSVSIDQEAQEFLNSSCDEFTSLFRSPWVAEAGAVDMVQLPIYREVSPKTSSVDLPLDEYF